MKNKIKLILLLPLLMFVFSACEDDKDTNPVNTSGGSFDASIKSTSYVLETIHSTQSDTSSLSTYNYSVTMNIKLNDPAKRSKIKKMVITSNGKFGWEFYSDQLNRFYVDTLGGYIIPHMDFNYPLNSTYQAGSYSDFLITIRLFDETNNKTMDYEAVIKNQFMTGLSSHNSWEDKSTLKIQVSNSAFYFDTVGTKIVWLNASLEKIGESAAGILKSNSNSYYYNVTNVPDAAVFYYFNCEIKEENKAKLMKGAIVRIANRYPSNVSFFDKKYTFNWFCYIPQKNKYIATSGNSSSVFVINGEDLKLEKQFSTAYTSFQVNYNPYDEKLYLLSQDGKLFSSSLEGNSLEYITSINSASGYKFAIARNYLFFYSPYDGYIRPFSLKSKSFTQNISVSYIKDLIYNETTSSFYYTTYSSLNRMKFNEKTGTVYSTSPTSTTGIEPSSLLTFSPDSTLLVFGNGNVISTPVSGTNDLKLLGIMPESHTSCCFSEDMTNLLTARVNSSSYSAVPELKIYNTSNFTLRGTKRLLGLPLLIFRKGDIIKVVSNYNSKQITEEYKYSELISSAPSGSLPVIRYLSPKKL